MPMSRSQCRDFQFPGVDISSANSTKSCQKSLCFKINDKSVRHFEKKRRTNICVTENYIKNFTTVTIPRNSNYANISKNGCKVHVVGDIHVKRTGKIDFNKGLRNCNAYFCLFSGATSKQLDHYIIPSLVDDKPNAVIIYLGTNDILCNARHEDIARNIIRIGSNCKSRGVNDVFISSILVLKSLTLNPFIRRVNDMLRDLCVINGLGFICNSITKKYLLKNGIRLQDLGTSISGNNFIEFVNNYLVILTSASGETNDFDSDIGGLINLRKAYQNNPLIGNIDINSLREKIKSLREVLSKATIDICVDETKVDASFPDHQFKVSRYQFPPLRNDRNSKGGGNSFCSRGFYCKTNEKF